MYVMIGGELREMIAQLREEKEEYENDVEIIHLAEKASELRSQLSTMSMNAEAAEVASIGRMASSQREIDRLAAELDDVTRQLCDLKVNEMEGNEMRRCESLVLSPPVRPSLQVAESQIIDPSPLIVDISPAHSTTSELFIALQLNRQLADESSACRVKIEQLEEELAAKEKSTLLSINSSQNITEAIQASKVSIARAAAQVRFIYMFRGRWM